MSGLLALLDDVAAIAKVAAASIDDIAAGAAKAGAKAAGVVIDDTAVTPKYVHGFKAERELPIIWRIARGSLKNKLMVLLPAAIGLANFLPQAITPLLMLGGAYLCFEGAEKVVHLFAPHASLAPDPAGGTGDPAHLEEEKVAGAIKTDFILSAEIMTISLAAIPENAIWIEAITLGLVGTAITVAVYGSVALIVKMDDVGLHLARAGAAPVRAVGRGLVRGMPRLLGLLSTVGTAAMLWVGGSIVLHGAEELGWGWAAHRIHDVAVAAGEMAAGPLRGAAQWAASAALDGIGGLALGLVLMPLAARVLAPLMARLRR